MASPAPAINGGGIFIYSCSAQLTSFEIESISEEINCAAEHEYMYNAPFSYRAGDATEVSQVFVV